MKVEVVGVYEKIVRCVLTGSRGRVSESKRVWAVLRLPDGRLEAIGISRTSARMLRKAGAPKLRKNIHALRMEAAMREAWNGKEFVSMFLGKGR